MDNSKNATKNIAGDTDWAEQIGLQALTFITSDDRAIQGFIAVTGIDPGQKGTGENLSELLSGALDFLIQDEARLIAFAESIDAPPTWPAKALATLYGQHSS